MGRPKKEVVDEPQMEEVDTEVGIAMLTDRFQREDLNALVDKVNEIITHLNK